MRWGYIRRLAWPLLALLFVSFLGVSFSVHADGGVIVKDPEVWSRLAEGEQIAVVRLEKEDTAQVDLFVSLNDASGESHEIRFFVPLGYDPTAFEVLEESLRAFQVARLDELDERLSDAARQDAHYRQDVRRSLRLGAFLAHGGWFWFLDRSLAFVDEVAAKLGIDSALGGDADQAVAPVATFRTEHALVELYDVEGDMDLEALIATTGLQPAVRETLRRLAGQQVAVITLQTLPSGQLGLRLAWTTRLAADTNGGTYAYPLGTGSAWARPIELTSVYVVAPPGVDFEVTYPRLGEDRSGYEYDAERDVVWPRVWRQTHTSGYAVDQALGDFGRVWRATYVQSQATEDIVITRAQGVLAKTRVARLRQTARWWIGRFTWVMGLLAAFTAWVLAWRFIMSRYLERAYHWRESRLWQDAGSWALIYLLFNAPLALAWQASFERAELLFCGLGLLLPCASFGLVNAILFGYNAGGRRAVGAYGFVVVIANVVYSLFAVAYLALVGGV